MCCSARDCGPAASSWNIADSRARPSSKDGALTAASTASTIFTDDARQPLRAAGTRKKAEVHLRQAADGLASEEAPVARERQLETTAKGCAVNCCHRRYGHLVEGLNHVSQPRPCKRSAGCKLLDVGTGGKGGAIAGDDKRSRPLPFCPAQSLEKSSSHRQPQRVDRRGVKERRRAAGASLSGEEGERQRVGESGVDKRKRA
eukprot:scaffold22621_cov24-Tisochrysis_lutea.AAC.3